MTNEFEDKKLKETLFLKLISQKSNKYLGWQTKLNTFQALDLTAKWFNTYLKKENITEAAEDAIKLLEEKGLIYCERGKYLNLALPHNPNL